MSCDWSAVSILISDWSRCYEKGREKCDQYWPLNTDPVYYGDIQVGNMKNYFNHLKNEHHQFSHE